MNGEKSNPSGGLETEIDVIGAIFDEQGKWKEAKPLQLDDNEFSMDKMLLSKVKHFRVEARNGKLVRINSKTGEILGEIPMKIVKKYYAKEDSRGK